MSRNHHIYQSANEIGANLAFNADQPQRQHASRTVCASYLRPVPRRLTQYTSTVLHPGATQRAKGVLHASARSRTSTRSTGSLWRGVRDVSAHCQPCISLIRGLVGCGTRWHPATGEWIQLSSPSEHPNFGYYSRSKRNPHEQLIAKPRDRSSSIFVYSFSQIYLE